MVVNDCDKALQIDSKFGLKSYTDLQTCYDADETPDVYKSIVGQLEVRTKVMTQQGRTPP